MNPIEKSPAHTQARRPQARTVLFILVGGGIALFMAANIHFAYMAFSTQPDCVQHLKTPGANPGEFRAAKPAC